MRPPRLLTAALAATLVWMPAAEANVGFTLITAAAAWDKRCEHGVTQLQRTQSFTTVGNTPLAAQTGWFVLWSGTGQGSVFDNDTWVSSDGRDWAQVGGTAPNTGNTIAGSTIISTVPSSCLTSSPVTGRLYIVSGHTPDAFTLTSDDYGIHWNYTGSQAFAPATDGMCVVDPGTNTLTFAGGLLYSGDYRTTGNQVYVTSASTNSWTQLTQAAPWHARDGMSFTNYYSSILQKTIIYIIAGRPNNHYFGSGDAPGSNDVWASSDGGASWLQLTASAPFEARGKARLSSTSSGVLILTGGDTNQFAGTSDTYPHDLWLSLDGGLSWGQCNNGTTLPYPARRLHSAYLDTSDYLWITGGEQPPFVSTKFNDVWRSSVAFGDSNLDVVASLCGVANPACGPGLQCWPTSGSCNCVPRARSSSSSSTGAAGSQSSSAGNSTSTGVPGGSLSSGSASGSSSGGAGGVGSGSGSGSQSTGSSGDSSASAPSSGVSSLSSLSTGSLSVMAPNGPSQTSSSGGIDSGAIAGIVIGILLALLLAVLAWYCYKRRGRRPYSPESSIQIGGYGSPNSITPSRMGLVGPVNSRLPWGFTPAELDTPRGSVKMSSTLRTHTDTTSSDNSSSKQTSFSVSHMAEAQEASSSRASERDFERGIV